MYKHLSNCENFQKIYLVSVSSVLNLYSDVRPTDQCQSSRTYFDVVHTNSEIIDSNDNWLPYYGSVYKDFYIKNLNLV